MSLYNNNGVTLISLSLSVTKEMNNDTRGKRRIMVFIPNTKSSKDSIATRGFAVLLPFSNRNSLTGTQSILKSSGLDQT